jgi:hypothetical protein
VTGNDRAAITYAEAGWRVVPLWWPHGGRCACPRGASCSSAGKHPLTEHGLLDASDDPVVVERWWRRWQHANVGGLTGLAFDVVDLDGPGVAGQLDAIAPGWRGPGPVALTGKGAHHFYAATGRGNRARVGGMAGFDYRGRGGYVVLAPSLHVSGRRYRWLVGPRTALSPLPRPLALVLDPPRPRPWTRPRANDEREDWSPDGLLRTMGDAVEGNRNAALYWAASRVVEALRAGRVTMPTAERTLDDLEAAACAVGLGEREAVATIRSAFREAHR